MRKKRTDERYARTERKILKALSEFVKKNPHTINVRADRIAKRTKLSRATIYRHYRGASEALLLYGRKIFKNFRVKIAFMQRSGASFADLIFYMLKFMRENRDFFEMAFRCGDRRIFERMMREMRMEISDLAMVTVMELERIKNIYYGEVYGVLDVWVRGGCRMSEIKMVQGDIILLTKHVRTRLGNIGWRADN